ncbi:MAG: hypothetical protein ABS95_01160 [Verrucomicrobia bacterium SCN 57-15]|nr:MAG: hypothetical protein ABS95_01160 [Verrucomicrobia bacterium SCN 57-15]
MRDSFYHPKRSNAISDTRYRWDQMRRQKAAREKWIEQRDAERQANLPPNDLRHEINRIRKVAEPSRLSSREAQP